VTRKTHQRRGASSPSSAAGREAKKERHATAARERERARRRASRIGLARKAGTALIVGTVVVVGLIALSRKAGPRPIPQAALAAAQAAGCGSVQTPSGNASGGHLSPAQVYHYTTEPATSGLHDPSPLPQLPHVYTTPVPETNAVHNLEHAYVLVYYRADGSDALPGAVLDALTPLVNSQEKTIMAPFADLPDGTSFALLAWNKLWSCPPTITPQQATAMASGFIHAFRGTGNAPEPSVP
jgi:hypothetical protein